MVIEVVSTRNRRRIALLATPSSFMDANLSTDQRKPTPPCTDLQLGPERDQTDLFVESAPDAVQPAARAHATAPPTAAPRTHRARTAQRGERVLALAVLPQCTSGRGSWWGCTAIPKRLRLRSRGWIRPVASTQARQMQRAAGRQCESPLSLCHIHNSWSCSRC